MLGKFVNGLHGRRPSRGPAARRTALLALALACLAGCAEGGLSRAIYGAGQQYACTRAADNRHDEAARKAQCMTAPPPGGAADYETYRKAREAATGD
ncbi:MAG: hypothetical protein AB7Q97_15095 [Gammaproteobacteria bacterium]